MNARLETFCDGVFAIAITLLILEIRVPPLESVHSVDELWHAVWQLWPSFFALSLSFTIIFISWIGHHNLLKGIDRSSSQFQMANGLFLFTIILMPFFTAFMAEYLNTPFAQPAIFCFCLNSTFHNIGWLALHRTIQKSTPPLVTNPVALHLMTDAFKIGKFGFALYAAISLLAWWLPYVALVITVLTWICWLYVSINVRVQDVVTFQSEDIGDKG